jgi:hypothetical protein
VQFKDDHERDELAELQKKTDDLLERFMNPMSKAAESKYHEEFEQSQGSRSRTKSREKRDRTPDNEREWREEGTPQSELNYSMSDKERVSYYPIS